MRHSEVTAPLFLKGSRRKKKIPNKVRNETLYDERAKSGAERGPPKIEGSRLLYFRRAPAAIFFLNKVRNEASSDECKGMFSC